MSKNVLEVVANAMEELNLEYGFVTYDKKPVKYPYFVGEYTESAPLTEDGLQQTTFMLNGFTRGSWLTLENAVASIENYFNKVSGKIVIVEDGSAVAIFYSHCLIVPTGEADLKRIQINLDVKEWSVT